MMRSLFSGVSGLKTHQTRMDVIGNNIANVNTTAYKAQNMVFSDLLYQQTQAASGANIATGRGGINARQIGLGSKTAAINTAITRQGSAQSTNNPWDVMISGESFFIVNSGSQNFFTRDGSFTIDGAGNLVMASTGYRVMGWQVDPDTGEILSGPVEALQVMNAENLKSDPEATSQGIMSGILDKNCTDVHSKAGLVRTLQFFDARGYVYTAQFSIHALSKDGQYYVELEDITDSNGVSLVDYYKLENINQIANFGSGGNITETKVYQTPDNVTYTDSKAQPATQQDPAKFLVDYTYGEILEGFSNSPMMGIAGSSAKVETINGTAVTDGAALAAGQEVVMGGEVKLDKDTLQSEYGLIYDGGKYYYKKDDGTRVELTTTSYDDWGTVLSKLSGDVDAAATAEVEIDQSLPLTIDDNGVVTLKFKATFEAAKDIPAGTVYNDKTGQFAATLDYYPGMPEEEMATVLEKAYGLKSADNTKYTVNYISPNGFASVTKNESYGGNMLVFDTKTGKFSYVGNPDQDAVTLDFAGAATDLTGENVDLGHFHDISIDFSTITNVNNGKTSTVGFDNGDGSSNNLGSGRKPGALIGVEIGQDGKIRASYDNGLSKLLGQIAVTKFANAGGLAKAGNNLYSTTLNSGEFDGVGIDITSDGEGSMESGVLEMSNVDLAGEFTEMITTQRGFQANSRIITTSDTMLEELVNLKR